MTSSPLLEVSSLRVALRTPDGDIDVVREADMQIWAGERVALVGESGSGKTMMSLAIMGLLRKPRADVRANVLRLGDHDLLSASDATWRRLRGRDLAMVFQDPMTSLNPSLTIGEQLVETLAAHDPGQRSAHEKRAVQLLDLVAIPDAASRMRTFPHELSGGMRQRVMLAMALGLKPRLLIADEPTTALDVTIQAQVLELMVELTTELGSALLLITHDLGVVADVAQRMYVMYAGRLVEEGLVHDVFDVSRHPYTRALLGATPRMGPIRELPVAVPGAPPSPHLIGDGCAFASRCRNATDICRSTVPRSVADIDDPRRAVSCWHPLDGRTPRLDGRRVDRVAPATGTLVVVRDLKVHLRPRGGLFGPRHRPAVRALDGISIAIERGETLGLVGESGSGKTTLARAIIGLVEPTAGSVSLEGVGKLGTDRPRDVRRRMQMIFQDPYSSLDPRMTVEAIVAEPLEIHGAGDKRSRRTRVLELLDLVGLPADASRRRPHEFSGGQRQRIGIARALALEPDLILADEPVSALDVSVQAQVLELLHQLQSRLGITYLFVAHNLAVVRAVSDRIAVMYLGRLVELGPADAVSTAPMHPYTVALLAAAPVPEPRDEARQDRLVLQGDIPSPAMPPAGCRFHTRCWLYQALGQPEDCSSVAPEPRMVGRQIVECHHAERAAQYPIATKSSTAEPALA